MGSGGPTSPLYVTDVTSLTARVCVSPPNGIERCELDRKGRQDVRLLCAGPRVSLWPARALCHTELTPRVCVCAVGYLHELRCTASLTDARVTLEQRPTASPHHRPYVRSPSASRRAGSGRGEACHLPTASSIARASHWASATPAISAFVIAVPTKPQPSPSPSLSLREDYSPSPSSPYNASSPLVIALSGSRGARLLTSKQRTVVVYSREVA